MISLIMMICSTLQRNQSREKVMSSSPPTVRRIGSWTQEEDNRLRQCIEKYGEGKWHQLPQRAGLNRCRKSCRLRWLNYLRPDIKRGSFDLDEVDLIIRLHKLLGNRWSLIAGRLPGRTANDVKNYWNTHVRKKVGQEGTTLEAECSYFRKCSEAPKITTASTIFKPRPRTFSKNSPWLTRQNVVQTNTCDAKDDRQNLSSSTDVFVPKSMSMSDQDDMQWLENLFNAKEMSEGPHWPPSNFEDKILGNLWSETWGGANGGDNNSTQNDFGNFCV